MTDTQIFEPDGRAIPYVIEGEGPVALTLLSDEGPASDGLGVISHYLVEEAGFHLVRIGGRSDTMDLDTQVADVIAVLDHIGLEHTWVGGHRTGGTLARAVAASHTARANGVLLLGVEDDVTELPPLLPVLIIQGSDDDVTPPAHGEQLQTTAPERVTVRNLDGAGHLFPLTHPIDTAFIIEEYLDWD